MKKLIASWLRRVALWLDPTPRAREFTITTSSSLDQGRDILRDMDRLRRSFATPIPRVEVVVNGRPIEPVAFVALARQALKDAKVDVTLTLDEAALRAARAT